MTPLFSLSHNISPLCYVPQMPLRQFYTTVAWFPTTQALAPRHAPYFRTLTPNSATLQPKSRPHYILATPPLSSLHPYSPISLFPPRTTLLLSFLPFCPLCATFPAYVSPRLWYFLRLQFQYVPASLYPSPLDPPPSMSYLVLNTWWRALGTFYRFSLSTSLFHHTYLPNLL